VVKGSVTISIKDYHALLDSAEESIMLKDASKRAAKELQVFLSFLCTRENIEGHIEEFNRQSKFSKIIIDSGIAKIEVSDSK
tara:strand:+ start:34 stop:279 length:246 start_codon:yes stop_codon:yes gene_type:complete